MVTFDQSCSWDVTYYVGQPTVDNHWRKLMEMENYADLMQRLLEIQSGERRSPKLIAEDERLMRSLQKRSLAGEPTQKLELSGNSPEQERFKA
jgi:hypothetical protein